MKHWQDLVNAAIGAWLAVTPWTFGFQGDSGATLAMLALGGALLLLALGAIVVPRQWEEWVMGLLGLAAMVAPWLLGLPQAAATSIAFLVTGLVIVGLVWWTLSTEPEYRSSMRPPLP